MSNSIKISLFIVLITCLLCCYRVDRKYSIMFENVVYTNSITPVNAIKRIKMLEDKVHNLECR